MAWWPWRKKNSQHVSDLGLRPLMDEFQNLRRRFRKTRIQTRTVVVVRKDITSHLNIFFWIILFTTGSVFGFWYKGSGGGDARQTVKEKMVSTVQETIKPAPPETPPEKRPLVQPARVESRAVVIVPAKLETTSAVLQKSPIPQKPPEPMSQAKRLLLQLEDKLPKE